MRYLFSFLLFGGSLCAQNLVVNPGFEINPYSETDSVNVIVVYNALPYGWYLPNNASPDYFFLSETAQNSEMFRARFLYPFPFEGRCYSGFIANESYNEYLGGTFSRPLEKDSQYIISVTILPAGLNEFEDSLIGIFFSRSEQAMYHDSLSTKINEIPHLTMDQATDTSIRNYWITYNFLYKAMGGERSFIIGNFHEKVTIPFGYATYFYVDSIYVGKSAKNPLVIESGKTLIVDDINFETNKARILSESIAPLNEIVNVLTAQPKLKVEIVGHTDSHGDIISNQKLSEERAKAVADYFISKGIDPSRITRRGAGSTQPLGDDDQKNRRVEFIFTE